MVRPIEELRPPGVIREVRRGGLTAHLCSNDGRDPETILADQARGEKCGAGPDMVKARVEEDRPDTGEEGGSPVVRGEGLRHAIDELR